MTPLSYWHQNRDGTAWLVGGEWRKVQDRPCGTCGGEHSRMASSTAGGHYADGRYHKHFGIGGQMLTQVTCPDCIVGRNTFTIHLQCDWCHGNVPPPKVVAPPCFRCHGQPGREVRASIVPGVVLPILDDDGSDPGGTVSHIQGGERYDWLEEVQFWESEPVTLPRAARPGMFAALVNWRAGVHSAAGAYPSTTDGSAS